MNDLQSILKQYWGYDSFRPFQEEAIRCILNNIDTLVLLPTGGGKSICFQVPAMAMEGICIVVTPLIALMKDQVEQLKRRHIPAVAIHAGMGKNEIDIALDNCVHGNIKFLYVSPERLRTEIMIERVKRMKVCLLAVDEAHCISAWGYDFRPSYLLIADFREFIPKVPVIALTATATEEVRADILDKLHMKSARVFKQSFARANLSYSTFNEESKERKLFQILRNVAGSAIVYVRTRKRTQELAYSLSKNGISATNYHGGLPFKDRSEKQSAWIANKIRVVVATNAFGMGIDKPDVRCVIHYDLPENLEAYYQEAGRAGRDERKAYAVALYTQLDLEELEENVERQYPSIELIRRVYQALANYFKVPIGGGEFASYGFDLKDFTVIFGLPVYDTHYALKILEQEGFIQLSENYNEPSKLHFLVDNRQLYEFQIRYREMDAFIKVLLRLYGGELYTEYVNISETEISQIFYAPVNEVINKLKFMQERDMLVYVPRRDKPQITFLTPRFDAEQLPLKIAEIDKKKKRDLHKVRAVIRYATDKNICRTLLLLEYFNEFDAQPCGVCDVCQARKKFEQGKGMELAEEITTYLTQQGPSSPKELGFAFEHYTEKVLAITLKQLIEEEAIHYNEVGQLTINKE